MHVRPITFPSDLSGAKNGFILGEYLTPTRGGDSLHHLAARAFDAMYAKADGHGIDLKMTDGYRPYETQESIFTARYTTTWRPGSPSKKWKGQTWWKRYGVATAAVPGTSNHGWGLATDISDATGERLLWLEQYAGDYGFSWELLPEEPWHIRYIAGDALPNAVLAYETAQAPTITVEEDDMYFVRDDRPNWAIWQVYRHEASGLLVRRAVSGVEWEVLSPRYESQLQPVTWGKVAALAEAPAL